MDTLTDRYIAAVTTSVPERARQDVATELRGSIEDAVRSRAAAGEPADAAELAVVTELGDPDVLAADYADRPSYLIGPRFYQPWRRLVIMLLTVVLPIAVLAVALGLSLAAVNETAASGGHPDLGARIGPVIGQTVGIGVTIAVHLVFWSTFVFAAVERSGGAVAPPRWTPDQLPVTGIPHKESLGELTAGLVWLAVLSDFLIVDQVIGLVWLDGTGYAVVDPVLWPWWIGALLAILLAQAIVLLVRWRRGTSPALAVVLTVLTLLGAAWTITALVTGHLLNPALWAYITRNGDVGPEVGPILSTVAVFLVIAITILDILHNLRGTRRSRPTAPGL
ncbi:permease prefix domain 1-containing protein [Microbacterium gorillae]|uniref:permease prefix domain 1-containing protein n=1 Tax=Microbacterium gorillae TaxID=1231063 RepID=UPI000693AC75|nr:permease prefix domain 1-containing protein [Microbacterium gorillae]